MYWQQKKWKQTKGTKLVFKPGSLEKQKTGVTIGSPLSRTWTRRPSELPSKLLESECGWRDGVEMHQHVFAMDVLSSDLGQS